MLDDLFPKVTGAKVVSKLDASSSFWQTPLTKLSSELTKFITSFGILFSMSAIWNHKCSQDFSKKDDKAP